MAWQGMACMRPLIIISGGEHREQRRSSHSSFPSTHLQIQVTVACNLLRMVVGWYYWCSPLTRAHPLIHVAETYYAWGLMLLLHAIRVRDTPHELPQSPGCRSHAACSARTCCSRPK